MNTGREDRAYPVGSNEQGTEIFVFNETPCGGGKGGGAFFVPVGSEMAIIEYKVSKFDVWNRRLVIQNLSFDIYQNLGETSPGSGEYLPGDRIDWWLGFDAVNTLTGSEVVGQDILITDSAPFEMEIGERYLPQPTDTDWDYKIYIYMYWGDSNYVINTRSDIDLNVIKHDYDERI